MTRLICPIFSIFRFLQGSKAPTQHILYCLIFQVGPNIRGFSRVNWLARKKNNKPFFLSCWSIGLNLTIEPVIMGICPSSLSIVVDGRFCCNTDYVGQYFYMYIFYPSFSKLYKWSRKVSFWNLVDIKHRFLITLCEWTKLKTSFLLTQHIVAVWYNHTMLFPL